MDSGKRSGKGGRRMGVEHVDEMTLYSARGVISVDFITSGGAKGPGKRQRHWAHGVALNSNYTHHS